MPSAPSAPAANIRSFGSEVEVQHPDRIFVGGEWVSPVGRDRFHVVSPHSEQVVAVVARAAEDDATRAVESARRAFDAGEWSALSPMQRVPYLMRMRDHLERRRDDLARAWTLQVGGPSWMAPGMVNEGLDVLTNHGEYAEQFDWVLPARPASGQGTAVVVREPVGVVLAIVPWNAPFMIMLNKVAPALLAGNSVVMKPAPETPLEAYLIAEAAEAAGIPDGVVNMVVTDREVGHTMVSNPLVDKVSFTGSTAAGRKIGAAVGGRIGRLTLELGGKSAAVALADADAEQFADVVAPGIALFSGQVCAALTRAVVPRARYQEFVDALVARLRTISVGDPADPGNLMGPLAMQRQHERVLAYLQAGRDCGARLVTGGGRPAGLDHGYYLEPTLFADVDPSSRIAQEEIFGPVLSVIPADDERDAIRIANDSQYGLYGGVFTPDVDAAYRVARAIRTGTVAQSAFVLDPKLPFGGFKQSGLGREGGLAGVESCTETKSILLNRAPSRY